MSLFPPHEADSGSPLMGLLPDPGRFFHFASRAHILERLRALLDAGGGVVVVTGEAGSGKTLLLRRLMATLPEKLEMALLGAPQEPPEAFLHAILGALEPEECPSDPNPKALFAALERRAAENRHIILAVDEAQRLTSSNLELLQIIARFRAGVENPVQIILTGRDEVVELMADPASQPLADAVVATLALPRLAPGETRDYALAMLGQAENGPAGLSNGGWWVLHLMSQGRISLINHYLRLALPLLPGNRAPKVITAQTLRRVRAMQHAPGDLWGVPIPLLAGMSALLLLPVAFFWLGRLSVSPPPPLMEGERHLASQVEEGPALRMDTRLKHLTPASPPPAGSPRGGERAATGEPGKGSVAAPSPPVPSPASPPRVDRREVPIAPPAPPTPPPVAREFPAPVPTPAPPGVGSPVAVPPPVARPAPAAPPPSRQAAPPPAPVAAPPREGLAEPPAGTQFEVQAGSFTQRDNAASVVQRLAQRGYGAYLKPVDRDRRTFYTVRIPFRDREQAEVAANLIHRHENLPTLILRAP